jgi:very-short-patch-repair endonuclease
MNSQIVVSPEAAPRGDHLQGLLNLCQSDYEREWLKVLDQNGYRLPSKAQPYMENCNTRPDFLYEDEHVVIYVDGYHHLFPDRRQRDALNTECLENLGYTVLRFGVLDEWEEIFKNNTYVFGKKS